MPMSFGSGGKTTSKRKSSGISLPVTDSLVAYFDANNPNSYPGAGNVWRDLTSRNQVAAVNTSITSFSNRYGGHLVMSSDGVNTPATATTNLSTNTITLMAWINPNAVQNGWAGIIMDRAGTFSGMQFDGNGGTKLAFMWNTTHFTFDTGITVPANRWSLVSIVVTPTTITPYLNGTAGNVLTSTLAAQTFSQFRLGWDNGASRVFQGKYGAAMIYNRSLSAAEVSSIYDFFKTRYVVADSNLRLHIDAGESASYSGSGTAVNDISGVGLNCTLTNGPTFSNGAFNLDNVNDVILTNSTVDLRSDFTLEGWFSLNVDTTANFFGHGNAGAVNSQSLHTHFLPGSGPNGNRGHLFALYFNDASSPTTNVNRPKNTWYHVVFTYSNSSPFTKKMYVNGVDLNITAEQTQAAYAAAPTVLRMGQSYSATGGGNCKIAQARYYNKVLTASEVLQNYNATKGIFYPTDFSGVVTSPALWLKADAFGAARNSSDDIITADNTKIAKLIDYSGWEKHAIQNTSAVQPSYRNAANGISGRPAIQFSTSNLQVSNFTRTAWTTFIVFRCSSNTLLYEHGTGWDQPGGFLYTDTNSTVAVRNAAGNTVSWRDHTTNWGSDNVTKLAVQRFNGTNASHILRVNGSQVTLTDRNAGDPGIAAVTATLNIGGRNGAGGGAFYLCELIMFDRALSDSDVEIVEHYLRIKWNLV